MCFYLCFYFLDIYNYIFISCVNMCYSSFFHKYFNCEGNYMYCIYGTPAAISLRLQGKLSFPYNCQKMNGQIYVLLC